MRKLLIVLAVLGGVTWGTVVYLVFQPPRAAPVVAIPILMVLPSVTPSPTVIDTLTATFTFTPTVTSTETATPIPTVTRTLATRVLEVRALLRGMFSTLAPTEFPFGMVLLPAPPHPYEPLPDDSIDETDPHFTVITHRTVSTRPESPYNNIISGTVDVSIHDNDP